MMNTVERKMFDEAHKKLIKEAELYFGETRKFKVIKGGLKGKTPPNSFDLRSLNLHLVNSM